MKLSLVVLAAGPMQGKVLPVPSAQFVIGRDPGCHLRPSSPMISKKHCALIIKEDRAFIKDFGSTNGSFVNESKVEGHRELKNGDKLRIGPLLFEVQLDVTQPSAKPVPQPAAKAGVAMPAAKVPVSAGNKTALVPDTSSSSEDDAAALWLSGTDETVPEGHSMMSGDPQGTTIMEMPGKKNGEEKPTEAAKPEAPPPTNSEKAAAILELMRKRPRNPNP